MIEFKCPRCQEELSIPDSLIGKKQKCPSCGLVTFVPQPRPDDGKKGGFLSGLMGKLRKDKGD